MKKHYTDQERYEHCRRCRISGKSISEIEKKKRRNHFDWFDHSVVEIQYKELKITTSLEQAEILLEQLYDEL